MCWHRFRRYRTHHLALGENASCAKDLSKRIKCQPHTPPPWLQKNPLVLLTIVAELKRLHSPLPRRASSRRGPSSFGDFSSKLLASSSGRPFEPSFNCEPHTETRKHSISRTDIARRTSKARFDWQASFRPGSLFTRSSSSHGDSEDRMDDGLLTGRWITQRAIRTGTRTRRGSLRRNSLHRWITALEQR